MDVLLPLPVRRVRETDKMSKALHLLDYFDAQFSE